jgi:hypothetical protein
MKDFLDGLSSFSSGNWLVARLMLNVGRMNLFTQYVRSFVRNIISFSDLKL